MGFCGRRGAIGTRSDKLNNLSMLNLGIVAPSREQPGWFEYYPSAGKTTLSFLLRLAGSCAILSGLAYAASFEVAREYASFK
jgi:hypothetical protein